MEHICNDGLCDSSPATINKHKLAGPKWVRGATTANFVDTEQTIPENGYGVFMCGSDGPELFSYCGITHNASSGVTTLLNINTGLDYKGCDFTTTLATRQYEHTPGEVALIGSTSIHYYWCELCKAIEDLREEVRCVVRSVAELDENAVEGQRCIVNDGDCLQLYVFSDNAWQPAFCCKLIRKCISAIGPIQYNEDTGVISIKYDGNTIVNDPVEGLKVPCGSVMYDEAIPYLPVTLTPLIQSPANSYFEMPNMGTPSYTNTDTCPRMVRLDVHINACATPTNAGPYNFAIGLVIRSSVPDIGGKTTFQSYEHLMGDYQPLGTYQRITANLVGSMVVKLNPGQTVNFTVFTYRNDFGGDVLNNDDGTTTGWVAGSTLGVPDTWTITTSRVK